MWWCRRRGRDRLIKDVDIPTTQRMGNPRDLTEEVYRGFMGGRLGGGDDQHPITANLEFLR
jgi:hypothetical protein